MQEAELILCVLDATAPFDKETEALLADLEQLSAPVILLLNKWEGDVSFPTQKLQKFQHILRISAKSGDVSALRERVEALYLADGLSLREDAVVANARQHAALSRAADALSVTLSSLRAGVPLDAACTDAEMALQALGEVDGRAVDEAIISSIFSHFCVGK
jgi:tRNA modification GTPase